MMPLSTTYTPQTFLHNLSLGISRSPLLDEGQRAILQGQIGAFGNAASTHEEIYPVVRTLWFMMAQDLLRRVPGSRAGIFGVGRIHEPMPDAVRPDGSVRRIGGRPLANADPPDDEVVIEASYSKREFEKVLGRYEDEGLRSFLECQGWNEPLCSKKYSEVVHQSKHNRGIYGVRIFSPELALRSTWSSQKLRPAYVNGMVPISSYPRFLAEKRWPVGLPTEWVDSGDSVSMHPLTFIYHDLSHLIHRARSHPSDCFVGQLIFDIGMGIFGDEADDPSLKDAFVNGVRLFLAHAIEINLFSGDLVNMGVGLRDTIINPRRSEFYRQKYAVFLDKLEDGLRNRDVTIDTRAILEMIRRQRMAV